MILNDPLAKTATIPVRLVDGKFINYITGKELSGIEDGALCDLIVDAYRITDPKLLALLNDQKETQLFPEGTTLYAIVNGEKIPRELFDSSIETTYISPGTRGRFVPFNLRMPLKMMFRGTKEPALFDCECYIPSLAKTAKSLNHAYTLISTAFELHRRSHTGNVFDKVYFQSNFENYTKGNWIPLDNLRLAKHQRYHEDLISREDKPNES